MAVTLKRKRGAVSYKEPSSDDDLSESSGYEQTTRKRTVPTRRSTRRPAADDEAASESEHSPPPQPASVKLQRESRTSRRRGAPKISYKDVSTDDEDEEDPDGDFELEEEQVMTVRTRPRPVAAPVSRSGKTVGIKRSRSRRKATIGAPLKPNNESQVERKTTIPSDGHKPVCLLHHIYILALILMSRPGLLCHITYSSKSLFTLPTRFTTRT